MFDELHNNAYIDGSNLHHGMKELGWNLDYKRFRVWLKDKYDIENAYIFLGYDNRNEYLYNNLKDFGFELFFKEIIRNKDGKVKANCDSELVMQIINDYHAWKFWKAVIVASDGDYACVAKFLNENGAFLTILSPRDKCSFLLKKLPISITYLNTQRRYLEIKKSP